MNRFALQQNIRKGVLALIIFLAAAPFLTVSTLRASAQGSQLSLADILIALRSKKVTLTDRNKILTEAIATRGTTFTLTSEIEKELTDTGASKTLLDSIRQRGQIARTSTLRQPPVETKPKVEPPKPAPVVQPPVQDLAFYEKRAQDNIGKGDMDAALIDYTRAIEIDGSAISVLMGRGRTYLAMRSFLLAIADFTKVIGLQPTNADAFARRGEASEGQHDNAVALNDYKKALELDPTLESAKAAVDRLEAEQAKLIKKAEPVPVAVVQPAALPEFVELGQINESRATKMVRPFYPQNALLAGFSGQVVVDIELDTKGNVTKAKAVSGNSLLRKPSEDAALGSKFQPAMIGSQTVKAKARIVYNYVGRR